MSDTFHATSVAFDRYGILILGPSGAGKSALALELVSRGARLVSDDLTLVELRREGGLWIARPDTAPPHLIGAIEARGVGILRVDHVAHAPLRLVIDMEQTEAERLPEARETVILGEAVPCLHRLDAAHFPASIVSLAKGARLA